MTKIRKNNQTIEINYGDGFGGCLRLFGVPVFIMGLLFFSNFFSDHQQEFHHDLLTVILHSGGGVVLMLLGVGLIFGSSCIVVDKNTFSIKKYYKLLFRKKIIEIPFDEIKGLSLKKLDEDEQDSRFYIQLKAKDRELTLYEDTEPFKSYQIASDVATYTGVKLDNQIESITQNEAGFSADVYEAKSLISGGGNVLLIAFFTGIFFYISSFSDNWTWSSLDDLSNNVVYVEFPDELFIYEQPGKYDLGLSFYQYKPSLFGNDQKQYLKLLPDQYQLSVQALDGFAKQAVSIIDDQLLIKTAGSYRVKIEISDGVDSPYTIGQESSKKNYQILIVEQRGSTNAWEPISNDSVPQQLQKRARILSSHFAGMMAVSLTELEGDYYFNASSTGRPRGSSEPKYYSQFYRVPAGTIEKVRWTAFPMPLVKSFLHSHQGLIYSFGGYYYNTEKKNGNWVYHPEHDKWDQLSSTPLLKTDKKEQKAKIVGLYSANDKLFVMVRTQEYALYQFDVSAEQQWQLIKQFSLPDNQLNWQYFDDKTLFSYNTKVSRYQEKQTDYKGYIQLLDLDTYQVKMLSITPKLNYKPSKSMLSPEKSDLLIFSDQQKFYGYFEGQFYIRN